MSTLGELLAEHTDLPGSVVDHLHAVVGEWQLLADMSFGDLLMWVRRGDGVDNAVVCVAQCRPNTAPTMLITDAVSTVAAEEALVGTVPVRYRGDVVALLTRQTAGDGRRTSSRLETAYLDCAATLLDMVSEGTFPNVGQSAVSRSSPRVGDGFIRLDVEGVVSYASPNALSACHRMGLTAELEGHALLAVTRPLISDPFEATELANHIAESLTGGAGMRLEVDAGGATVLFRTLPLVVGGRSVGAAVLVRDVTEVKRRDRALLSKDATIREIHHRVKNNLQTVAALLRLQARRTANVEGRHALLESVRRVAAIAEVHEALSMSVDEEVNLDAVIDRILPVMNDVVRLGSPIRINREGTLGVLDAERATALVMVVTELVQNAVQHGFEHAPDPGAERGRVVIRADRSARSLNIVVHDDGCGLPAGFSLESSERLGLQIVRTLVSAELDGTLEMRAVAAGGTDAVLRVPIGRKRIAAPG
ncbi:MAG: sensor histidine kinase [Actinomycetia bacterium]|nr:sensor histidine kinase [Actinomycetes bacterium]